tara:strand:+ start:12214 stop:14238 length:2025 start_codon:yes stop_codon:yes gene_type:complete
MSFIQKQKLTDSAFKANDDIGTVVATDGRYLTTLSQESGTGTIHFYQRDSLSNWVQSQDPWTEGVFTGINLNFSGDIIFMGLPSFDAFLTMVLTDGLWGSDVIRQNFSDSESEAGHSITSRQEIGTEINLVVVGAPGEDSDDGSVFIFESSYDQLSDQDPQKVFPDIRVSGARFGTQVAIAGDYIIVGAYEENNSTGAVYVFKKNDSEWEQTQKIYITDGATNDQFGFSIAGYGDFFIVGAPNEDVNGRAFAGAAYLFENINNSWELVSRITSSEALDVDRNIELDFFGYDVDIDEDYAVVGSYGARGSQGIVDVFSRNKGWGYIKTLTASDGMANDKFGLSVSVDRNTIVVGAPGVDDIASEAGAVYFFQDVEPTMRLAQEFNVRGEFVPSKTSIYLKRSGNNVFDHFPIENDNNNPIDATNFQSIKQKSNKIIFNDTVPGFTDNGYMQFLGGSVVPLHGNLDSDYPIITYPIKVIDEGVYTLWLRARVEDENPSASGTQMPFVADIMLDNVVVTSIVKNIFDNEWVWVSAKFTFADTIKHNLGIRIKGENNLLDKILITADNREPFLEGPPILVHPFITTHLKVYEALGGDYPVNPLYMYDYKNSIDEVINDDWYNFNINIIDPVLGYANESDFPDNYFLVFSTSGNTNDNYVTWELVDNDEYTDLFSAIKY